MSNDHSLKDHSHYVNALTGSKDSLYKEIVGKYERYLMQHPNDVAIQIERCRFIEKAYIEEEFNPKYDEFTGCVDSLWKRFPENPDVLLYKMESLYYDDSLNDFLFRLIELRERDPDAWQGKPFWKVYERLAQIYDGEEDANQALAYAIKATQENDTLDLTVLMANQYIRKQQKIKAKEILVSKINDRNGSWELNEKGKLLLQLGEPTEALKAFRLAKKDTTGWIDETELAKALIENGLASEAREYLVSATKPSWSRAENLIHLLEYDLKHSPGDSACVTYRKLVAENFWYDPIGVYRVRLLVAAPLAEWKFSDVLRMFILALCLGVIIILPYTWILPVHFLGMKFSFNRRHDLDTTQDYWTLRDFWLLSSLVFFNDFASAVLFDYDTWILSYVSTTEGVIDEVNSNNANSTLFFMGVNTLIMFIFLKREQLQSLWGHRWTKGKSIGMAIAGVFALKFAHGFYLAIINFLPWPETVSSIGTLLTINDAIISINKYYHPALAFLAVVIVVPIYEEIFFRGIVFSAVRKHMNFVWANIIQSALFATIHWDLKHFPFYLAFGLIAGYYRNKSGSLVSGMLFHMLNNLIAFFAILLAQQLRDQF